MNSPTKPAKNRPAVFNSRLRKLLLISLPVWLIAAMVCAKFVSMTVENRQGIAAYGEGDHGQARTHFSRLGVGNVAESWIAHYNRGTANFQLRVYAAAQQDFERAVQSAPAVQQCKVRINLALALEARGDDEAAAQSPDRAAELYRQADQVLAEANCADPTPTEPSASPTPSSSGQPSQDPSAQPSQNPSGQPSQDPNGEPSQDPSGQPSDQPGEGEPTQGGEPKDGQGGEPSEAEQQQRKEQTQERLEEKAEEADRNAKRQERREPTEPKEQDQSDPNDSEESMQDQLEKQNQESEQDSAESRDRQKGQSDKKEGKVEDPGGKKRPW